MAKKDSFSKFVDERGVLLPEAKKYIMERFGKETLILLNIGTNENEYRVIGSILSSIVNDLTSAKIQETKKK